MLITGFTMAGTGISHHLPRLMGALVMSLPAFLSLMNEPEMKGNREVPADGDLVLRHVFFAYQGKEVLHDVSLTLGKAGALTGLTWKNKTGHFLHEEMPGLIMWESESYFLIPL